MLFSCAWTSYFPMNSAKSHKITTSSCVSPTGCAVFAHAFHPFERHRQIVILPHELLHGLEQPANAAARVCRKLGDNIRNARQMKRQLCRNHIQRRQPYPPSAMTRRRNCCRWVIPMPVNEPITSSAPKIFNIPLLPFSFLFKSGASPDAPVQYKRCGQRFFVPASADRAAAVGNLQIPRMSRREHRRAAVCGAFCGINVRL